MAALAPLLMAGRATDPATVLAAADKLRGVVKCWDDKRGFGFITPEQEGEDIFFHFSGLKMPRSELCEMLQVRYAVEEGRGGKEKAVGVEQQRRREPRRDDRRPRGGGGGGRDEVRGMLGRVKEVTDTGAMLIAGEYVVHPSVLDRDDKHGRICAEGDMVTFNATPAKERTGPLPIINRIRYDGGAVLRVGARQEEQPGEAEQKRRTAGRARAATWLEEQRAQNAAPRPDPDDDATSTYTRPPGRDDDRAAAFSDSGRSTRSTRTTRVTTQRERDIRALSAFAGMLEARAAEAAVEEDDWEPPPAPPQEIFYNVLALFGTGYVQGMGYVAAAAIALVCVAAGGAYPLQCKAEAFALVSLLLDAPL
eukprot:gene13085-27267_t